VYIFTIAYVVGCCDVNLLTCFALPFKSYKIELGSFSCHFKAFDC
jgi:hypothetical protein